MRNWFTYLANTNANPIKIPVVMILGLFTIMKHSSAKVVWRAVRLARAAKNVPSALRVYISLLTIMILLV